MLLNSVNPIDYVLDIVNGNKEKQNENDNDKDQNSYKNLKQEEEDETINDSNAIKFNELEKDSPFYDSNNFNNRYTNIEEHNQIYHPRTKSKLFNYIVDKLFLCLPKFLKLIGPLFCLTIIIFLLYTYFSI